MTALGDAGFAVLLKRPVVVGRPREGLSDSRSSSLVPIRGARRVQRWRYPLAGRAAECPPVRRRRCSSVVRTRRPLSLTPTSDGAVKRRLVEGPDDDTRLIRRRCRYRTSASTLDLAGERVVDAPSLAPLATVTAMSDSRVLERAAVLPARRPPSAVLPGSTVRAAMSESRSPRTRGGPPSGASGKRRWRMPRAADNARAVTRPTGCRDRCTSSLTGCPISLTKRGVEACHQTPAIRSLERCRSFGPLALASAPARGGDRA